MEIKDYYNLISTNKNIIVTTTIEIPMPTVVEPGEVLMLERLFNKKQKAEITNQNINELPHNYTIIGDDALGNFIVQSDNNEIFYWDSLYAYCDFDIADINTEDTETFSKYNSFLLFPNLNDFLRIIKNQN